MSKPGSIKIEDATYVPVVLKVDTLDENGRPESCTMVFEQQNIELAGGEWFLIGYIDQSCIAKGAADRLVEPSRGLGSPKKSVL